MKHLLFILFFFYSITTFAEGTKQAAPASTDVTMLYTNSEFASFNSSKFNRLYFRIKNAGQEQVYIGLSQRASNSGTGTNDGTIGANSIYYFRIKNAAGAVVHGPIEVNKDTANANTWQLASNGPAAITAGGYETVALPATLTQSKTTRGSGFRIPSTVFTAPGDYFIEFSASSTMANLGTDPSTNATATALSIKYWDITVASTATTPVAFNGRVWSYNWQFRTPKDHTASGNGGFTDSFNRPFNGSFHVFSDNDTDNILKGFVSKIDFLNSGFRGLTFSVSFNSTGPSNMGTVETNRQSLENTNSANPEFPIFFSNPDPTIWTTRELGTLTSDPVLINCGSTSTTIELTTNVERGQIEVLLDFNGNDKYDINSKDRILATSYDRPAGASSYNVSIPWDLKDGLGNDVSKDTEVSVLSKLQQGVYNFPVYDVERLSGGFKVTAVRPAGNFTGLLFFDDTKLVSGESASISAAAKENLSGCMSPCHTWTAFNTTNAATVPGYGNLNTVNTWWVANRSTRTSVLTQTCPLLPVELISFYGEQKDESIRLKWETATETNNDYFEILRSENGINFLPLEKVKGSGDSKIAKRYSFEDKMLPESNQVYYKLKQVDFDGATAFSDVISFFQKDVQKLIILENPIQSNQLKFAIPNSMSELITIAEVINIEGKLIKREIILPSFSGNLVTIDLNTSPGVYILRLSNNEKVKLIRFVKN